jgi:phosphatidylinositol glycan class C protein
MEETRWRKILYVKQPFEDNYVDHTFLNELVKNANFTAYSLSDVMKDSAVIIQQISVVTLFVLLFVFTLYSSFSLPLLLSFPSLLLIIGFSVRAGVGSSFSGK